MISPLALAAKKVIDAAWEHGPSYDLSSQAAFALDSAGLLNSPEHAAEVERLRARVAELEAAAACIGFGVRLTADAPGVELRSTNREFVEEQLASLRGSYPDARLVQLDSRHGAWTDVPVPAPSVEALHASSGAVIEVPARPRDNARGRARLDATAAADAEATHWRRLGMAPPAAVEAPHETPPRPRPTPHDLPEVTP